jgi:hypothetical protein
MLYGDMLAVDEDGKTINLLRYRQLSLEDLLCFQIIGQPAVFFRRTAYEKTGGFDPSFHFLLDHHLWIRLAQQGKSSMFHKHGPRRVIMPKPRTAPKLANSDAKPSVFGLGEK